MQEPALPPDETERLAALHRLDILDTPPEARFDRITRLACSTFNVPIALVSLVDSQRQWFKSCQGLDVRETPRSLSFCAHALFSPEILLVADTLEDPRFVDHPAVTGEPKVRFYAGCPLRTADERIVGTLCVVDREPRTLSADEAELLRGLAAWVENELNAFELKRLVTALQERDTRLLESEQRFRHAFDYAPIGIALVSPTEEWLRVNPALCELVGYSAEELQRRTFQDITHPDDLAVDLAFLKELLAGKRAVYTIEKRYLHRLGHTVWISLSASLVRTAQGEPAYFVSQIEDITERRRLEQLKSEFLATAAHELRSPMSSILGFSELLLQRQFDEERRRELLGIIHEQASQLTNLINELLDLARIEAGGRRDFNMKRQPLLPVVERTLAAFLTPPDRDPVQWEIATALPEVAIDAEKLRQALTNLLSNAYKYSQPGSNVSLRVEQTLGGIVISVRDRGTGMNREEVAHMFERFYRGAESRKIGGSGLGLSIVKEIVELHGGRIEIDSEHREGTTVSILLPV